MLGPRPCHTGRVRPALPAVAVAVAVALLSAPASAAAYDRQIAVGVTAGWGLAPALEMFPNHGPTAGLSASLGFDPLHERVGFLDGRYRGRWLGRGGWQAAEKQH